MKRHGLALVEVMVALLLASTCVLLVHSACTLTAELVAREGHAVEAAASAANARRYLGAVIGSMEVGSDSLAAFHGTQREARFAAWLVSPSGGFTRRSVALREDEGRLEASSGPDTIILASGLDSLHIDYLLDLGADAPWQHEWRSPATAPLALRLRCAFADRIDTLLFVVGPRG